MSLRRRLLLGSTIIAIVLFVADIALASTFRSYLVSQVDKSLAESAAGFSDFNRGPHGDGGGGGGPPPRGGRAFSEFYLAIYGANGVLIDRIDVPFREGAGPGLSSSQVVANATRQGAHVQPFSVSDGNSGAWRMAVVQLDNGALAAIGAPLAGVNATYARMVAVLIAATSAVLATLVVVAYWVLRQGVRPLAAMTATAEEIAEGAYSQRVADTSPKTEAGRLGHALNVMLARIEEAFARRAESEARLRRFVADASHELRTPVTSIRGYAELYRQGGFRAPGELDEAMRRVEQEGARMGSLVEDLLLLARLDQGRPLDTKPVRLDGIVSDAVADARAVEPDRPIAVDTMPISVTGDEDRLRQAVGNLLANVRVHTPAGTAVSVSLSREDGSAVVEVADQGPGLDAEAAARVFERFYRADPARTRASGGAGLGLSIVASIVQGHGGWAELDTAPGEGARFRLHIPAVPVADELDGSVSSDPSAVVHRFL